MNAKKLSAFTLMIVSGLILGAINISSAQAFGGKHFGDDVDHELSKLENGIQMTITTDDNEVLQRFQHHEPRHHPNHEAVDVNQELLNDGVRVTITSDDTEVVARLHQRADRQAEKQSITRSLSLLDNGVEVTLTSTLPEVVEKLQNKEAPQPKNDQIQVLREHISNGVKITITTDDEDLVENIQKRAEQGPKGHGKRGLRRGHRAGSDEDRSRGQFGPRVPRGGQNGS